VSSAGQAAPSAGAPSSSTSASGLSGSGAQGDSASGRTTAARHAVTPAERARQEAKRSTQIRNVVTRLSGCLSDLSPQGAQVLSLRAGIGGPRPNSAATVARILKISPTREATIERGALTTLRTDGRAGCGAPAATFVSAGAPFAAQQGATLVALAATPASLGTAAGAASSTPQGAQSSQNATGGSGASGGGSSSSSVPPGPAITSASVAPAHGSLSWTIAVLAILAILAIAFPFVLNTVKHRRHLVVAAGTVTSQAPPMVVEPARPARSQSAAATDVRSMWLPAAAAAVIDERPASDATPADATSADADAVVEPTPSAAGPAEPTRVESPAGDVRAALAATRPTTGTVRRRPREPSWLRGHASQAALIAASLGGALVTLTRRSRRH
jgi:hypothetical protein